MELKPDTEAIESEPADPWNYKIAPGTRDVCQGMRKIPVTGPSLSASFLFSFLFYVALISYFIFFACLTYFLLSLLATFFFFLYFRHFFFVFNSVFISLPLFIYYSMLLSRFLSNHLHCSFLFWSSQFPCLYATCLLVL
jgi:hypothetical protein